MSDFEEEEEEGTSGAPAWMATFADLMSLLLCFFVLLLSFSVMDVQKYKQIAGSMRMAFGVQNQQEVLDIPKGTSVIAKEFSPGKTTPIPSKNITQITEMLTKPSLRVGDPNSALAENMKRTQNDADKLRRLLKKEIKEGIVDIEAKGNIITIRIRETGTFPSGSDILNVDSIPLMSSLRHTLKDITGEISIEGHTDNVPLIGTRFKSNWGLSAARALSVAHELLAGDLLDERRFVVVGHADTRPFAPNNSAENRAQNRRVEIKIRQGNEVVRNQSILPETETVIEFNPEIQPEPQGRLEQISGGLNND